jgi:hypothetical protein
MLAGTIVAGNTIKTGKMEYAHRLSFSSENGRAFSRQQAHWLLERGI